MVSQFSDVSPMTVTARPSTRDRLVSGLLNVAFLTVMLDGTIVYVALPSIQRQLDLSTGTAHWVMTSFLLSFGGLLLLGGRMAELLGRRRMFMAGLGVFAVASLVCGLAPSGEVLIGARAVQGMGAALIATTALPLLAMTFNVGPARNRALSAWTAVGAFGGTAGLLFGGPITDRLGWQWIFLINVPVGLGLIALAPFLLPAVRAPRGQRSFDLAGALTATAAFALLVYAIAGTSSAGWAGARTIGLLSASAVLLAGFFIIEARTADPLVPLHMLRSRRRLGGMAVLLVSGMAIDGMLFLLTLYGQHVLGMSATRYGLTMAVTTLASVVGSFAGQTIVLRYGLRSVAAAGMALTGIGFILLTTVSGQPEGTFISNFFIGMLIFGAGLGAAFVAAQIAVTLGVTTERESMAASGLTDSSFSIGGAIGLAVASTVFALPDNTIRAVSQLPQLDGSPSLHLALAIAGGYAVLGLVAALLLLDRPDRRGHDRAP